MLSWQTILPSGHQPRIEMSLLLNTTQKIAQTHPYNKLANLASLWKEASQPPSTLTKHNQAQISQRI